jgi:peptidoglycan hydrolase-like protein with peptidoglycan-binding domain
MIQNPGVIEDPRSEKLKEKDYLFKEIVATADPVTWIEKDPNDWRSFTLRDQDGSGSCVKQALAKTAEVLYFANKNIKIPFSAGFYKFRSNYPDEGMWIQDAFEIWRKMGICPEAFLPSQKFDEKTMNNLPVDDLQKQLALAFKIDAYTQFVPGQDFETIASTIQKTGKAVHLTFRFKYAEWTDIPEVLVNDPNLGHAVSAVDFTLYKGKKYLVIEDSWGNFNKWKGRRLISEAFFKARNTAAFHVITFKYHTSDVKPSVTFKMPMSFGDTSQEVVLLQDCLKSEGLMPFNVSSTGYYGSITAKAVYNFQKKYKVASDQELDALQGRSVGPKTLAKLNEIFSK